MEFSSIHSTQTILCINKLRSTLGIIPFHHSEDSGLINYDLKVHSTFYTASINRLPFQKLKRAALKKWKFTIGYCFLCQSSMLLTFWVVGHIFGEEHTKTGNAPFNLNLKQGYGYHTLQLRQFLKSRLLTEPGTPTSVKIFAKNEARARNQFYIQSEFKDRHLHFPGIHVGHLQPP